MIKHEIEITKEEYLKAENGNIPGDIEDKYIPIEAWMGYGVYDTGVEEKDGKYYLWYETGSSCD